MVRNKIKQIALGGILAAIAVVIMCMGGLIPFATYISPMLCCLTQLLVLRLCGKRVAWTWYFVVCLLSAFLCADKEAVTVFVILGYYPMIKSMIDQLKFRSILKIAYFNFSICIGFCFFARLIGINVATVDDSEFGIIGLGVILLLGNATFLLMDKLLSIMDRKLMRIWKNNG